MATNGGPLIGYVEVVFVGGPFHAERIGMGNPAFHIDLELDGERTTYCRRLVEAEGRDGGYVNVATYAPVGICDEEFTRLVVDAVSRFGGSSKPRPSRRLRRV